MQRHMVHSLSPRRLAALALLALAPLLPAAAAAQTLPAEVREAAADRLWIRDYLRLYDLLLSMQAALGEITVEEADAQLAAAGWELYDQGFYEEDLDALREALRGTAKEFLDSIDDEIASSTTWPTDLPAESYRSLSSQLLRYARSEFERALTRGADPGVALRAATLLLAFARGYESLPADFDYFAGTRERASAALPGIDLMPIDGGVPALRPPTEARPPAVVTTGLRDPSAPTRVQLRGGTVEGQARLLGESSIDVVGGTDRLGADGRPDTEIELQLLASGFVIENVEIRPPSGGQIGATWSARRANGHPLMGVMSNRVLVNQEDGRLGTIRLHDLSTLSLYIQDDGQLARSSNPGTVVVSFRGGEQATFPITAGAAAAAGEDARITPVPIGGRGGAPPVILTSLPPRTPGAPGRRPALPPTAIPRRLPPPQPGGVPQPPAGQQPVSWPPTGLPPSIRPPITPPPASMPADGRPPVAPPPVVTAPVTPPAPQPAGAAASKLYAFQARWIGVDADVVSKGSEARPDGSPDGHIQLTVSFSSWQDVTHLALFSSDANGTLTGGQVWHTKESGFWILGALGNGMNLNVRHLPSLGRFNGTVTLDLYAGDSGWFTPGQTFLVEMGMGPMEAVTQIVQVGAGGAALVTPPVTPSAGGAPTPPAGAPAGGAPTTPVSGAPPAVAGAGPPVPADWNTRGESHRGEVGTRYTYTCPPNGTVGPVWGTDVYTDDSSVCTAAVHAGLITLVSGGAVTIEMRGGESAYRGEPRNGVTSWNYGAWEGSFVFPRPGDAPAAPPSQAGAGQALPAGAGQTPAANALLGPEICGVWRWFDRSVVVFDADGGLAATGVNAPSVMLVDRGRWELVDPARRQYRIVWPVGQDLLTLSPDENGLGGTNVGGAVQVSATRTGACGAAPPSPPGDFDAHVSYGADWIGMDADFVGVGASATPDGVADAHFTFTVDSDMGPYEIRSIAVMSSDSLGAPTGGQAWHSANSGNWLLGVVDRGVRLNDSHVPTLGSHQGFRKFDLYAANSGWFRPGQHFLVEVDMGGGTPLRQVVRIPESFQPDVPTPADPAADEPAADEPAEPVTDEPGPDEELPVPSPMFTGTIALERSVYPDDEPVRVTFRDFPRGDERIVVAVADAEPEEYITGVWTDGSHISDTPPATRLREGSVAFIGFFPGEYEVRVFSGSPADGHEAQAVEYFTVEPAQEIEAPIDPAEEIEPPVEPPPAPQEPSYPSNAVVRADRESFSPGEAIVVRFEGFPGYAQDWIEISPVGASDESYGEYQYLGGQTAGTLQFSGLPPGTYEVRGRFDWPNGGYAVRTRSTFTVTAPADPPMDRYRVAGLSAGWVGMDADIVPNGSGAVSPDGAPDGHFALEIAIEGSVELRSITVFSSDAQGNSSGGQIWTTGSGNWVLGVAAGGQLLNAGPVETLGRLQAGTTRLDLYAGNSGWFNPGQTFVVELGFADGQKAAQVVQVTGTAYRVVGLTAGWVGMDADVVPNGSGAVTPDGAPDGHFAVEIAIEGSVELRSVTVFSSDAQGNPSGGQTWNTGSGGNWVLGVAAGGQLLHAGPVETLGTLQAGTTRLDLYAGNSGWFNPGQTFVVELGFADGQKAAQVVQVTGAPPDAPVPPPVVGEAVAPGATGTTWGTTAVDHRGQNGQRFSYTCPPGGSRGVIWGTDLYTDDTSICTAAVHAGLITYASGGTVTIEIRPGATSYVGSERYGVSSNGFGNYDGSYVFIGADGAAARGAAGGEVAGQVFSAPTWSGLRVDLCLVWGGQCGEPAATEFCRRSGYVKATDWQPAYDIGAQTPTVVLGTGETCTEGFCDGFASITCSSTP
ncbi:MAG TPA: LCCL domain-containing protein [Gemmatimonadota bacterium]|nr:LCCL domain-containing protein [Gemmatimonadota bacterium]